MSLLYWLCKFLPHRNNRNQLFISVSSYSILEIILVENLKTIGIEKKEIFDANV